MSTEKIKETEARPVKGLTQEARPVKGRPSDGLIRQNIVLMSGLLTAPVIAGAKDFSSALAISLVFALITFFSVALCRLVPRRLVYTLRIILYAIVASALYIPTHIGAEYLLGEEVVHGAGIWLPVLVVNHVILSKTETRFFHLPYFQMLLEVLGYIGGFAAVCMITGTVRDIFVNSRIGPLEIDGVYEIPALETTFGGFFVVGVLAGLCRAVYNYSQVNREDT